MNAGVRIAAVALTLGLSASFGLGASQGIAYADRPPPADPALLPPGAPAAPLEATENKSNTPCTSTVAGGEGPATPGAQNVLNLFGAWQFSRGAGQTVAVIDTGVSQHPRLPDLVGLGDYVSAGDGLDDCDAHGTMVAGIIAARPIEGQGFHGVAPEARILSIRQTSAMYQRKGLSQQQRPEDPPKGYGNIDALARAVVRAADHGATVINMSLVLCTPGSHNTADGPLAAALRYAVDVKDVVVVAAAGNKRENCAGGNPGIDPISPHADLWESVTTNVTPARYDDYVLSVGSIDTNGRPSEFTVPGPWVGVAAPGEDIVSLDPRGAGVINATRNAQGEQVSLQGTSFAAPYVAGVAALVRSRYPHLRAREVIERIEATAHPPAEGWNPYIGYGAVDPIAALTHEVPEQLPPKQPNPPRSRQLAVPAPPQPPDHTARNVALIGSGVVGSALILGYLSSFPIRRRFGVSGDDS